MLGSSWLDLVAGVDIHLHLVPTAAGPVPTPIPQPYLGPIGDPVGMMVAIAQDLAINLVTGPIELPKGPVLINGFAATTTEEKSKNTPLELPRFGGHLSPSGREGVHRTAVAP